MNDEYGDNWLDSFNYGNHYTDEEMKLIRDREQEANTTIKFTFKAMFEDVYFPHYLSNDVYNYLLDFAHEFGNLELSRLDLDFLLLNFTTERGNCNDDLLTPDCYNEYELLNYLLELLPTQKQVYKIADLTESQHKAWFTLDLLNNKTTKNIAILAVIARYLTKQYINNTGFYFGKYYTALDLVDYFMHDKCPVVDQFELTEYIRELGGKTYKELEIERNDNEKRGE